MVAGLTRKEMTTEDRQPTVRDCLTVGCEEAVMDKYMEAVMVSGVLQAEVNRLEAINADLLEVLGNLVEIDRRDNTGDPDTIATDRWRHEAWSHAYAIVANAEGES